MNSRPYGRLPSVPAWVLSGLPILFNDFSENSPIVVDDIDIKKNFPLDKKNFLCYYAL
jgi:hypothetical protein